MINKRAGKRQPKDAPEPPALVEAFRSIQEAGEGPFEEDGPTCPDCDSTNVAIEDADPTHWQCGDCGFRLATQPTLEQAPHDGFDQDDRLDLQAKIGPSRWVRFRSWARLTRNDTGRDIPFLGIAAPWFGKRYDLQDPVVAQNLAGRVPHGLVPDAALIIEVPPDEAPAEQVQICHAGDYILWTNVGPYPVSAVIVEHGDPTLELLPADARPEPDPD